MFKDLWNVKPISAHSTSFGIGKKVFLYLKVNSAYDFILFFFWLHLFFMKIIFRTSMLLYRFSLFIFTMRIWRSYIYIYFCSGESQDTFTIKRKIIYIFISLYSWSYLKGCMQAAVLLLHNSWVYRYRKLSKLCL